MHTPEESGGDNTTSLVLIGHRFSGGVRIGKRRVLTRHLWSKVNSSRAAVFSRDMRLTEPPGFAASSAKKLTESLVDRLAGHIACSSRDTQRTLGIPQRDISRDTSKRLVRVILVSFFEVGFSSVVGR